MFDLIPVREYILDGFTFRYHPYMTSTTQDMVHELYGDEGLIKDRWAAQVWASLIEIESPDGETINPPSMNVTLEWIKSQLPARVISELINRIDDGEIPLGENSRMDEFGVPMMTIWKSWDLTRPLFEELTGDSTMLSLERENQTSGLSDS